MSVAAGVMSRKDSLVFSVGEIWYPRSVASAAVIVSPPILP
jgi:hypothetical protein